MNPRNFRAMLEKQWSQGHFVCVGLDPEIGKLPTQLRQDPKLIKLACMSIRSFCQGIVDATKDVVCAYKPNSAFFEIFGAYGAAVLADVINGIHQIAPEVPVILDAKRADIGNTNNGYVGAAFQELQVDAITVHPYLGKEALLPFLAEKDKGIIVLCRTSNPGAGEFQDLPVILDRMVPLMTKPLYQVVARQVASSWNTNGNCAVVVGATYPEELAEVRRIVGDMPILIPGIGAQGGDVEKTVKAGKDSRGQGMIINSSRGIIYASSGADFAEVARREVIKLNDLINQFRL